MPRNTLMMIHNAWSEAVGSAAELRKAADDLDVINEAARQAYLLKAGDRLNEEELVAMMDAETWLTAEQCIELGLADRLADQDADMSGASQMLQRNNLRMEQRLQLQKSLAAQLRELVRGPQPHAEDPQHNDPAPAPDPKPAPEEPQQNAILNLFSNI